MQTKSIAVLTLLLLAIGLAPVRAATGLSSPVLTNFYQPHFIVAPNAPPTQVIKSRIFGTTTNITTNIFNNTVNIFTNSTIIINGTNLAGGDSLWTNRSALYYPTVPDAQTIVFGRSAETWASPTTADGLVIMHDRNAGDNAQNSVQILAADNGDPLSTAALGGLNVTVGSSGNLANAFGHMSLFATSDFQGFGASTMDVDVSPDAGAFTLQSIDSLTQDNYGRFTSSLGSSTTPSSSLLLFSATNYSNPSAPTSKFSVDLQPAWGQVLLDFVNNGIHEFSVSNQITSVQALQLVPITNTTLVLGANQLNVQSNSFISLESLDPDPTLTTIALSTGLRDGMVLLLKNVGISLGFTLPNGSPLYDDPTKYVTLPGGTWVSTNYGDSMLLAGGLNGWTEVRRWGQNTNVQTDQLWELVSGHMRTVPDTLDDWQFRSSGLTQLLVQTNGSMMIGSNSLALWPALLPLKFSLFNLGDDSFGETNTRVLFGTLDSTNHHAYSWWRTETKTNLATWTLGSYSNSLMSGFNLSTDQTNSDFLMYNRSAILTKMSPAAPISLSGAPYRFDTVNLKSNGEVVQFQNAGTNMISVGPGPQINFGYGGFGNNTNVLYLSNDKKYLIYTNGVAYPGFEVDAGDGSVAQYTAGGNLAQISGTAGVDFKDSIPGGNGLRWSFNKLLPGATNSVFGGATWNGVSSPPIGVINSQTNYIVGFEDTISTNFSRLSTHHTGTNGAVVFDSQSAGIAGPPRPIMFTNQPTVIIAGTTNFLTFGATNAAPVDAVTIDKWVSVSINGEATEYRMPLYK